MVKIDTKKVLLSKMPNFFEKYPKWMTESFVNITKRILHQNDINEFLEENQDVFGLDFVDNLFKKLDFDYTVRSLDMNKIPSEGRLIVVSNHPMGGLDGLAIVKLISEVRKDVRIVVNDLLINLTNLSELFLPYDVYNKTAQKNHVTNIIKAIENEEAVIFFPAGVVSRLGMQGIKDKEWQRGAIKFATKFKTPVLPIYIDGKNSALFYSLALLKDRLGTFLLPHELFLQKSNTIHFKIGKLIPKLTAPNQELDLAEITDRLYKHVYNVGKDRTELFPTEVTVAHPVDVKLLKNELYASNLLGRTKDGKVIFEVEAAESPNVLKEIGRLREVTFRKVDEGTGLAFDLEKYDNYYKHLVLWDEKNLDIVGSYRMGLTKEVVEQHGKKGLIAAKKFEISDDFDHYLGQSLEVGRTFVQAKYWGTYALDYIWQGIGAFLQQNQGVRYLWGTVSMSDALPKYAKNLIVHYYMKWYSGDTKMAVPPNQFIVNEEETKEMEKIFTGKDHLEDFRTLKKTLRDMGHSIPVLFRKYTDMCEYGGVQFLNFCIDVTFKNSVDGFIVVDLTKLRDDIRERYYMSQKSLSKEEAKAY